MRYPHPDIETDVTDNKLSLSKWEGEVSFSVNHSKYRVNHYPIRKPALTNKLRWLNLGGIEPIKVPIEYELSHHKRPDDIQISTYWSNKPALMYFGQAKYPVENIDIPEVRAVSRDANPYYMDDGLVMFNIHYNGHELNYEKELNQAMIDVLSKYDVKAFNKGPKLYYKDSDGNDVKISSPETLFGHTWTYLNVDCDYNKYLKYSTTETPRDKYAYGLKRNYPNISKEVVSEIVQRFAELIESAPYEDKYTPEELKEIERLKQFHSDPAWVKDGQRSDPGYSYLNDEGHEYEIILDSKPDSNIIALEVETDNLIFYHQDSDRSRPSHAQDSWAAYHADETKHHIGHKYKAGKAFHIYASVAIDADGNKVRCFYDPKWNGKSDLEITIPKDFLNKASYPITIDPHFGYTTAGGSTINGGSTAQWTTLVNQTGFAGVVSSIWFYGLPNNPGNYLLALYNNSTKARVDYTASLTTDGVSGWHGANTVVGATLSAIGYDIGASATAGSGYSVFINNFDTATNAGGANTSITYASPPASTEYTVTTNNNKYSYYASTIALQSFSGSLELAGGFTKTTVRSLPSASLNVTGSIAKLITVPVTGALNLAGNVSKAVSGVLYTGSTNVAGSLSKTSSVPTSGSLNLSGNIISRVVFYPLNGAINLAGSIKKFISGISFSGTLNLSGNFFKTPIKSAFSAAFNLSGITTTTNTVSRLSSQDTLGASATSSVSATYPGATTAGDLLIATVYGNNANAPAISGWTGTTEGINGSTAQVGLFYKIADGTETTITATETSATVMKIHLYEYSGNANPIALDVSPTGNGNASTNLTSFSTASINTTQSADLIFGTFGLNGNATSLSVSAGLNQRQVDASTIRMIDGDLIPGVNESGFTGTASWSNTLKASAIIVAFEAGTTTKSNLSKQAQIPLPGSLNLSGSLSKRLSRALSGSLNIAGSLLKSTIRAVSGSLSWAGNLSSTIISNTILKSLSGSLSLSGNLSKQSNKSLSGSLNILGSIARFIQRSLTASQNLVGTLRRFTPKRFSANLSIRGSLTKTSFKAFSGSLSFSGLLSIVGNLKTLITNALHLQSTDTTTYPDSTDNDIKVDSKDATTFSPSADNDIKVDSKDDDIYL